jgi:hypothetical protein
MKSPNYDNPSNSPLQGACSGFPEAACESKIVPKAACDYKILPKAGH